MMAQAESLPLACPPDGEYAVPSAVVVRNGQPLGFLGGEFG